MAKIGHMVTETEINGAIYGAKPLNDDVEQLEDIAEIMAMCGFSEKEWQDHEIIVSVFDKKSDAPFLQVGYDKKGKPTLTVIDEDINDVEIDEEESMADYKIKKNKIKLKKGYFKNCKIKLYSRYQEPI
jgi:hypothetical protein